MYILFIDHDLQSTKDILIYQMYRFFRQDVVLQHLHLLMCLVDIPLGGSWIGISTAAAFDISNRKSDGSICDVHLRYGSTLIEEYDDTDKAEQHYQGESPT